METMTLNFDLPKEALINTDEIKNIVTDFVQKLIDIKFKYQQEEKPKKSTAEFRKLRGILKSDLSYKEMVAEALSEKYGL